MSSTIPKTPTLMSQTPVNSSYYTDKETLVQTYINYSLIRTQSMFVYENLPDTIPVEYLEYYLQTSGHCCIAKVKGELYALLGSPGGEYDAYYQPTTYTVANPYLDLSNTYTIGKDCVLAKSDYMGLGILPLLTRYSGLMAENVLTIRASDINMRNMFLLSAPDDDTLASAQEFVSRLEDGKLSVIADSPFFEGIRSQTSTTGNGDYMIQFIELQQYLKGSMYNELGLNANFNMKREALSGDELAMNDDALMPLIDQMLEARRKFVGEVNDLFGTDISVDFGSTWHSNTVEKAMVADSEYDASTTEATELAGNEATLPDSDASQLASDDPQADNDLADTITTQSDGSTSQSDSQLDDTTQPDPSDPNPSKPETPTNPGTKEKETPATDTIDDASKSDSRLATDQKDSEPKADDDKQDDAKDKQHETSDKDPGARGLDTENKVIDKKDSDLSNSSQNSSTDNKGEDAVSNKTTSGDEPDVKPDVEKKKKEEEKDED